MVTATQIQRTLSALKFNPKKDPAMAAIIEIGNPDYYTRRASEHLAAARRFQDEKDLKSHKEELEAAVQLIVLALTES